MEQNNDFITWFRNAAPYIHAHHGKTFVLQITSDVIASDNLPHLIHDLALLNSLAIKLVIVFGTRRQINALLKAHKLIPQYTDDLRVTDEQTIQFVKQAAGDLTIQIEALLSMGLPNSPMAGAEITVASGNYITAKPYGVIKGIDMGLTGRVRNIHQTAINARLDAGEIVLIPPLGYSATGEVFNLNSIEVATQIAIDLAADKLILCNKEPILTDQTGTSIRQITCTEIKQKLANHDLTNINETTMTTLSQGIRACEAGVDRIHLINQNIDGSILQELFSRDGIGTLLSGGTYDTIHKATVEDIGGILALIKPLEQQGVLIKRSREKIETEIGDYIVLVRDGMVIACAALHHYPNEQLMEIACLVVHPDYQNQANGDLLYQFIESTALKNKTNSLFVLTTQTAHWFLEKGFTETSIDAIPIEKQQLYNFQRQSKALIKKL